jgi:putative DNA primase/helicase
LTSVAHPSPLVHAVAQTVAWYRSLGWATVRVPPMSKAPIDRGWPTIDYPPQVFSDGDNIGIKLGDPSGGLVDVDLDSPEAIALAPLYLPTTCTFGRVGPMKTPAAVQGLEPGRARHWLYRCTGAKTWKPTRSHIEIRSTGTQTIVPGSVHETGAPIEWVSLVPPVEIDEPALRAAFARLALATTVARAWAQVDGARHDLGLALAGTLWHAGWPEDAAAAVILPAAELANGRDSGHRAQAIRSTWADDADKRRTGLPTVEQIVGPLDAKAIRTLAAAPELGYSANVAGGGALVVAANAGPLNLAHSTNDDGNASHLLERHGDELRFAPGIGWLRWDGKRWRIGVEPWDELANIARDMQAAGQAMGGPAGKALADWGRQSGNASKIKGAIEVASHRAGVRVEPDQLDADPWLFNCPNGVIDLRTGLAREHRREDLITKLSPIAYDPSAQASRFLQFLLECMGGDVALAAYVLRFLGYAMTGSVREHVFGLWHGAGRNGKSTLINAALHVFGDYGGSIPADVLLDQGHAQHPTGLMDLHGRRFVATVEPPAGRRWNESLVKMLTGGDPITARRMRMDPVTFSPTHTIVMACNARPIVRDQGPAFWSRVAAVPWEVSFRGREDRDLDAKLRAEATGILSALVAACVHWQRHGLAPTSRASTASEDYQASQDVVGMFVGEHLHSDASGFVPRASVYEAYRAWALRSGEHVLPASAFYRVLEERGWQPHKREGVRGFVGWGWNRSAVLP